MFGGARRDRTDDLMLAKHALYQLSYGPYRAGFRSASSSVVQRVVGPGRFELPTSRLSGVRSNQLSYGPIGRIDQILTSKDETRSWARDRLAGLNG